MAHMDQLLTDVQPGKTTLVSSVRGGFIGGVLDGQLGMEVTADEAGVHLPSTCRSYTCQANHASPMYLWVICSRAVTQGSE